MKQKALAVLLVLTLLLCLVPTAATALGRAAEKEEPAETEEPADSAFLPGLLLLHAHMPVISVMSTNATQIFIFMVNTSP